MMSLQPLHMTILALVLVLSFSGCVITAALQLQLFTEGHGGLTGQDLMGIYLPQPIFLSYSFPFFYFSFRYFS